MQFSLSALLILVAYSAVATCLFLWFDEPGLLLSLLIVGMLLMAAGYVKHRRGIAISGIALFLVSAAMAPLLLSVAIGDGSREVEVRLIIVDSETRQPISLARVEIEGGAFGGDSTSSTLTDANGLAWFVSEFPWSSRTGLLRERAFVYAGGHLLRVEADGYRPIEAMFRDYTNGTWPSETTRAPDIVVPLKRLGTRSGH